jgi:hypothetical protein
MNTQFSQIMYYWSLNIFKVLKETLEHSNHSSQMLEVQTPPNFSILKKLKSHSFASNIHSSKNKNKNKKNTYNNKMHPLDTSNAPKR